MSALLTSPVATRVTASRSRRFLALAVLMLPVLLISVDNTILSFALPSIARALHPDATTQLWIVDAYPLVLAGLLVVMGSIGDRIGRRRILVTGATGFALLSVAAAFATDAWMLVAARIAMGVFGAMLMPATLSIIRNVFPDAGERRMALAVWSTMFAAGNALGPLVGGALLAHFHWGSVFLVAVPILVVMLVAVPFCVPESRDRNPGPVDVVSMLLSLGTLAPVAWAIKSVVHPEERGLAIAMLGVGVLCGVAFVRRQLRSRTPMLDLRLFRSTAFTGSVLMNMAAMFSLTGFLFFIAQHLQLVAGLDPFASGVVLIPGSVLTIVAGLVVVPIVARVAPRWVVAVALLFSAAAYALVAVLGHDASIAALAFAFVLLGIGIGASETVTNDLIISTAPADKAGAASAVSETAYEIGAVLGTAILGTILATAYRAHVVVPSGLSSTAHTAAQETLGGAVAAASSLGGSTGQVLLESARAAFDSGVTITAGVAAVLMVVAAAGALVMLRRR
ncbi:MFS transporter [Curtobacterium sp. MCLR17_007]|uniref:MFS transporter n=1 Tax=unclassified Curtobacterium TaxID=257496 RepID=UPI0006FE228C|nr:MULTISPECIES: MFS transporter [unclassified Curtobacterium]KQS14494.1 MFS transporter [Curtobacterium sp. Leaf183]WIB59275.1 MFS transporter [Curtobacterium sp. MCLR17_007]